MFAVAILVFIGGVLLVFRSWFQGSVQGESESLSRKINISSESVWSTVFSKQFFSIVKIFILDIVLQRRILKESVSRWSMHSLIFIPILLRFILALFTATSFKINPDSALSMSLIDKNAGFTAFINDFLGLLILFGIMWSVVKRYIVKPEYVVSEVKDNVALVIIGSLIVLGFILEAARILIAGVPASIAGYAFIGYPLSKFFALFGKEWWASFYSVLWYLHAGVGALFFAWLPFGKMRHIFTIPLTYFIEAVSGVKRGEDGSAQRQK
jgi:nitrate reductase gamma subunit